MGCREICKTVIARKTVRESYYELGFKRCQFCCEFIKWDGVYCPCCSYKLRVHARANKNRKDRQVPRY